MPLNIFSQRHKPLHTYITLTCTHSSNVPIYLSCTYIPSFILKTISSASPTMKLSISVTRLGDLLHVGQLFKASGSNYFTQIAHICMKFFEKVLKSFIFQVKSFWATFIDIWQLFSGHNEAHNDIQVFLASVSLPLPLLFLLRRLSFKEVCFVHL